MTTELQPLPGDARHPHGDAATAAPPAMAPTLKQSRRRRRPSGAPPPLPRHLGRSGRGWLVALGVLLVWMVVIYTSAWARRVTDRVDAFFLRQLARLRTDWLTDAATAIDRVWSEWPVFFAASALIVLLVIFKRWRHLITFVGSVVVYAIVSDFLYSSLSRPRPYDVTTIGDWGGFSLPSLPVGAASLLVVAVTYSMVVPGKPRTIAKSVSIVAVGALVLARLHLAVDHPSDQLLAIALAVGVMVNAFRFFTPNEVFPVAYRRGKSAHLDVTGRRADAIRSAVRDQLGLTVLEIKPVGLAGSGGSTPLRLRVAGDPDTYLFGKLYAMNHVRADRWYKTGRTILYGRLEDEAPFQSVRRLVQYEDYTLRLMRDSGVATAAPAGIVELTPGREYLLVTEFFDGAVEIGDAVVDDGVIDEGLALIRRLWDSGLAHRDIKPANLLVRDGHVMLIDVAFAQVRPSPWRQAVDLANMMLVLAVRTDAERVYHRALRLFTPDEIAEAFAATRGIASPTQLRTVMKQDGRDLVADFRALAPERQPISLQRWSIRRVVYALALVVGVVVAAVAMLVVVRPGETEVAASPTCGTGDVVVLMAQAVPNAVSVPCIASLPAGWELSGVSIHQDEGRFWLSSDRGGSRAVDVRLRRPEACAVADAVPVPTDEVGTRRFEEPKRLPPELESTRYYLFEGGCVTYEFGFSGDMSASLMFDIDHALSFEPRATLVDRVRESAGLRLSGAGAPCPGGS
jgi:tRNA A-37 threonylcarbamoyl transferase component Bud32